jgi:hypothetical protein
MDASGLLRSVLRWGFTQQSKSMREHVDNGAELLNAPFGATWRGDHNALPHDSSNTSRQATQWIHRPHSF